MSNQGLRRVLENRDPRGYFHALSNWSTEEYQRSRENVGVLRNQIVRPSTYQGPTVPTSDTRVGTSRHQRRVQWSGEPLDNDVKELVWRRMSLRWLSAVSLSGLKEAGSAIPVVEAW